MKKKSLLAALLIFALLTMTISGCTTRKSDSPANDDAAENSVGQSAADNETSADVFSGGSALINASDMFSDRDFEIEYDEGKSAFIQLNGNSASCDSNAVQISGSTVTISDEGTYILSGTLDDGMIIVNAEKTDKTQLILNGVDIHSESCAPIYILQSDKVFITTVSGTENTLSNGGQFIAIDENNIDAAIFSKEDLTLNGEGTLVVTSPAGHGIVSKDSLTITSGSYDINCASHALSGKDDVSVAGGNFAIVSGKDGIHAENTDDASLGCVYIQNGTFDISTGGDGLSASSYMQIDGGVFDITTGGGSVNAAAESSDSWGSFMGGGKHQNMNNGAGRYSASSDANASSSDSTSIKAVKATTALLINGGTFKIDSADDAFHSNADATINGGTFDIASGDDAFHADQTLKVLSGTINISKSYEGLEGLHIVVSGGDITLVASDDGLNAAGGTDSSGITGGRDGMFGQTMTSSNGSIVINGGTLDITASGDGIDANGTLEITGGYTVVCGPVQGDTATLDYDKSAVINGGTFIGTGAYGMAQTFSDSGQGVIAVSVGSQSAGTEITLTDSSGSRLIAYTPELPFAVVILSNPDIIIGETYTVTVGSISGEITAG